MMEGKKTDTHESVSAYYGSTLKSSEDLKTNACCTVNAYPEPVQQTLELIHDEVLERYYGCGLTIPEELDGKRVLDLGSGSGRDCYIVSRLVGQNGYVVGVDMTDEQLNVARRHIDFHMERFGYSRPNVEFRKGLIEHLGDVGLDSHSFDLVISNCVINLCPDKPGALREIYRVLKPSGRFYFSDVYSDKPVPAELVNDAELYGECLSGAMIEGEFIQLAIETGFEPPLEVERTEITINNDEVRRKVGDLRFNSITFDLVKQR